MSEPSLLPLAETPIACSLGAADLTSRLAQWRRLLAGVTQRADGEGPHEVVLRFGPETSVAELAALCAEEVACCPFFTFDLRIVASGAQLTIAVPVGAEATLREFAQLLPDGLRAGST